MTSIAVLGSTGNLGRHVAGQALAAGWNVSVAVRSRARLLPEIAERANVLDIDLASATSAQIASFAASHDAFVSCAGVVTEGEVFVTLVERIVTALDSIEHNKRPVCWFLAGAALLPLDGTGRLGVDLPKVRSTYWPHRKNYERLQRSKLDWRLLCPGPMVEQAPVGLERLRVSIDSLPAPLPSITKALPAPLVLPMFAMKIPEMIIPFADAASVMLANVSPGDSMSRHRVGVALPLGMKGKKSEWAAQPRSAA
ncbi:NAD(P)-dependent oxidoreductase [Methylibium rhizosphaerae]|uniref:NAD(P)-dependent oxidoreductase n=1 Tax=Methylibium rhizosphaerae TaxID=2570323 RepID=UPI0011283A07|nr:NAD(P)H-binding protein [Methylibium rhizosphaerae]